MLTPAQLRAARALLGWSGRTSPRSRAWLPKHVKGFEYRGSDPKLSTVQKVAARA